MYVWNPSTSYKNVLLENIPRVYLCILFNLSSAWILLLEYYCQSPELVSTSDSQPLSSSTSKSDRRKVVSLDIQSLSDIV